MPAKAGYRVVVAIFPGNTPCNSATLGDEKMRAIQIARSVVVALGALALAQGLSFSAAAQNVYKTVDDAGLVTFTDRPPFNQFDGTIERVMGLDIDRTEDDQILAANDKARSQRAEARQAQQQLLAKNTEAASEAAVEKKERAVNCDLAKDRRTRLNTAHRVYRNTKDGEREYLSSAELDSARAGADSSIQEWCG
jgi:hypothetical protein